MESVDNSESTLGGGIMPNNHEINQYDFRPINPFNFPIDVVLLFIFHTFLVNQSFSVRCLTFRKVSIFS